MQGPRQKITDLLPELRGNSIAKNSTNRPDSPPSVPVHRQKKTVFPRRRPSSPTERRSLKSQGQANRRIRLLRRSLIGTWGCGASRNTRLPCKSYYCGETARQPGKRCVAVGTAQQSSGQNFPQIHSGVIKGEVRARSERYCFHPPTLPDSVQQELVPGKSPYDYPRCETVRVAPIAFGIGVVVNVKRVGGDYRQIDVAICFDRDQLKFTSF